MAILSQELRAGVLSEFLPRYAALVQAGIVFSVTYSAATIAAPSATATGPFALFNPAPVAGVASVQLVLLAVLLPVITATAGATGAGFGFQFVPNQTPTATTPGNTPQNALIGNATVAKATTFTAGTLVGASTVAANWVSGLFDQSAAGAAQTPVPVDVAGAIVVGPNSGVNIVMSGTQVATVAPSLLWAEIPLA